MCNYIHTLKLIKQVFQIYILSKCCQLALSTCKRNMLKYSTKMADSSISPYGATAIFICVLVHKYAHIFDGISLGVHLLFMTVIVL